MSQHTDEAAFTALHSRDRLADDGTPALSSRFVRYLDGDLGATRHGTPPLPLSLDEARARLAQDYPELAAAVDLCCVQERTLRAAAGVLHVCHRTVRERKVAGVAQLIIWCGLSEAQVDAALRTLMRDDRSFCSHGPTRDVIRCVVTGHAPTAV